MRHGKRQNLLKYTELYIKNTELHVRILNEHFVLLDVNVVK